MQTEKTERQKNRNTRQGKTEKTERQKDRNTRQGKRDTYRPTETDRQKETEKPREIYSPDDVCVGASTRVRERTLDCKYEFLCFIVLCRPVSLCVCISECVFVRVWGGGGKHVYMLVCLPTCFVYANLFN